MIQTIIRPEVKQVRFVTWNAMMTIAGRDILRFLRDPMRLIFSLILPLILVGGLTGTLQSNLGRAVNYDLTTFSIIGMLAMNLFQTPMMGITSLIEERETDFSQELFIAPVSRYAIIFGKILGETTVALVQCIEIILSGLLLFGLHLSLTAALLLIPAALATCLFGGAFGTLLASLSSSARAASQLIPFLIMPQFLLSGVFTPIRVLPWYLDILSKLTPLRYVVDLLRGIIYIGDPAYNQIVLMNPIFNLLIIGVLFVIFMVAGTYLFVRNERNR
uniref:Transport permease protein n=1 Tax=Thermosporothrix sp. COM3 TaxID=2490863 RepID=A0A455SGN1_9CHLR|nr:ABC transporter [Thermosporothrix sp. COM3]